MSCIVDDWCQEIVSLIESQIARTKNQDPEIEYVEVFLSGGGSQSRALQAVVRHQLASEEVKVSVSDADSDRSAVAQGNIWALLDEGELCRPKYARVSYGIPLDVRYESDNSNHVEAELIHGLSVGRFHGERYLVNSIHWAITMVSHRRNLLKRPADSSIGRRSQGRDHRRHYYCHRRVGQLQRDHFDAGGPVVESWRSSQEVRGLFRYRRTAEGNRYKLRLLATRGRLCRGRWFRGIGRG